MVLLELLRMPGFGTGRGALFEDKYGASGSAARGDGC